MAAAAKSLRRQRCTGGQRKIPTRPNRAAMTVRRSLLSGLLLGVLVLAGCGGGGGGGEERLTKEEWIAQADAICKRAAQEIDALGTPQSLDEVAELAAKASEIGRRELGEIRALQPPEEDEATIEEMLALSDQLIDIGEKIGAAAEEGDLAEVQKLLQEGEPINDQADQLAQDYGLEECGQEGE